MVEMSRELVHTLSQRVVQVKIVLYGGRKRTGSHFFLLWFPTCVFLASIFPSDEEQTEERRQRRSLHVPRPPGCGYSALQVRPFTQVGRSDP